MKHILFLFFAFVMCANGDFNTSILSFDLDKPIPLNILRQQIGKNIIVSNDEIENLRKEKVAIAKMRLRSLSVEDKNKIKNNIIEQLYMIELQDLFEKELKKYNDKVVSSYYTIHKEEFKTSATVDLFVMKFKTKKDALDYNISKNLPEPLTTNVYKNYKLNELSPNFALIVDTLKENELSPITEKNGEFIRVYFKNKQKERILPLKDVKEDIKQILFNKKRVQLLELEK